jgi:hypothetical protein
MRNIFWWLLLVQVLSPEVDGWAVWLYLFFPFLDLKYYRYALNQLARIGGRKRLGLLCFLASAAVTLQPGLMLKAVLLMVSAGYVFFLVQRGDRQFDKPIIVQTAVSIVQFIGFTFFDAELLSPRLIGEAIWGNYALSGGGQFSEGFFLFSRVSGLCREPGFYSSVVSATILLTMTFGDGFSAARKRLFYICAGLSLLLAFSKITVLIGLVLGGVYLFRAGLAKMNGWGAFIVASVFLVYATRLMFDLTGMVDNPLLAWQGGSIFFRTVGYYLLSKLDVHDWLVGLSTPYSPYEAKYPFLTLSEWWGYDKYLFDGAGISYFIINGGLPSALFFCLAVWSFRINAIGIFVYSAFLFNANPYTLSAFVVILYSCSSGFYNVKLKKKHSSADILASHVRREQVRNGYREVP